MVGALRYMHRFGVEESDPDIRVQSEGVTSGNGFYAISALLVVFLAGMVWWLLREEVLPMHNELEDVYARRVDFTKFVTEGGKFGQKGKDKVVEGGEKEKRNEVKPVVKSEDPKDRGTKKKGGAQKVKSGK